jgi:hypothetical protein
MILRRLLWSILLLTPCASLRATVLSYSWTAVALPDSTLDGQTFSGDIIFSGTSDTTLAEPNPITTGAPNFGFPSTGAVQFSIPSLNATGVTSDIAYFLAIPAGGLYKFVLSPNDVNGDIADIIINNLADTDQFNASETVSGSQFVEAIGTSPVTMATINGVNVSNTTLHLDTDPNQNATFTETVGAPEPASWCMLLAGAVPLLLRRHRAAIRKHAGRRG